MVKSTPINIIASVYGFRLLKPYRSLPSPLFRRYASMSTCGNFFLVSSEATLGLPAPDRESADRYAGPQCVLRSANPAAY